MIEQMVNEMGKRWAEIARRLRNRSDNAVKNWWNGSMNRRKRSAIQHGHSAKGIGNRLQPIPAVKPVKGTVGHDNRRRYLPEADRHYEHHWPEPALRESQKSRHLSLPAFPPSVPSSRATYGTSGEQSAQDGYSLASEPSSYPSYSASPSYSRCLPSLNQFRTSGPMSQQPDAQSFQQMAEHARRSQNCPPDDRFGPALLLFDSQRSHDPALISPVSTEASCAPSVERAPSLVSDNQSNYSISPKTVPSPRPDMPAPIDTDIQVWARQLSNRRDSPLNILSHSKSQSKVHPDEGYVSAVPQSAISDYKAFLPLPEQGLHRRESVDAFKSSHYYPPSTVGASMTASADPPQTYGAGQGSKDSRMHLSNLLG